MDYSSDTDSIPVSSQRPELRLFPGSSLGLKCTNMTRAPGLIPRAMWRPVSGCQDRCDVSPHVMTAMSTFTFRISCVTSPALTPSVTNISHFLFLSTRRQTLKGSRSSVRHHKSLEVQTLTRSQDDKSRHISIRIIHLCSSHRFIEKKVIFGFISIWHSVTTVGTQCRGKYLKMSKPVRGAADSWTHTGKQAPGWRRHCIC